MPHAVIKALKMLRQSKKNKSARSANPPHLVILSLCKRRSIHFSDLKSKAIHGLCANLKAVALICSYIIDFIYCLKSLALDTSLHCVSLSMTRWGVDSRILDCFAESAIRLAMTNLCALRRHCEALQTPKQSTTFIMTIRRGFTQFTRFATFHTTFKGIKMQT